MSATFQRVLIVIFCAPAPPPSFVLSAMSFLRAQRLECVSAVPGEAKHSKVRW
jgi:hypothetical protein